MNEIRIIEKCLKKYFVASLSNPVLSLQFKILGAIEAVEDMAKEMGYDIYCLEYEDYIEVMIEYEGKLASKFSIIKEVNNEKIN